MMGCVEMRMKGTIFIVKFLEAKKLCIIMELKLLGSQKVTRKQKDSWEIKTPRIMANTIDQP